jgi:hypothetical protein
MSLVMQISTQAQALHVLMDQLGQTGGLALIELALAGLASGRESRPALAALASAA